jgi:hypothetical protein
LLALLALAPACAGRGAPREAGPPTVLLVRNDNYLDHNIYLLEGGQRIRLGTARGLTTSRFRIPSRYIFGVSVLQFLADPIGGTIAPVSERLNVSPGDEITLVIRGL